MADLVNISVQTLSSEGKFGFSLLADGVRLNRPFFRFGVTKGRFSPPPICHLAAALMPFTLDGNDDVVGVRPGVGAGKDEDGGGRLTLDARGGL